MTAGVRGSQAGPMDRRPGTEAGRLGWRLGLPAGPLGWLLAAVLALVLGVPAPALAHAELTASDPADGAVLGDAPLALSFTFGEQLLRQGNAVTATRVTDGARVALGALIVSGDTVSTAWPADEAAGAYRAAYRVVSADGHPITGTITFRIGATASRSPATPSAATSATSAPPTTPAASPTTPGVRPTTPGASPTTPGASPTTPGAPASASPQPGPGGGGDGGALWLGLGLMLVVALAAGAALVRRGRS